MAVRGDRGDVVAHARIGVEWTDVSEALDPVGFPMLWALDPYGDAVFNQRQIPLLQAELDRLPAACGGEWVAQARDLCQVVRQGVHLYLWFIGD
ncbi:hypothetical protein [Streptomyces sp. SID3343]|uniref:hypothetical protein n=1 Tax=Streptomyces sp. SID3343 TaxID=2690260 RepID=UPI0019265A02|nr:hypothetical protein [Streptomyces sp. SID3343]